MSFTGGDVLEASSGLLYIRGPGQALVRIGTDAMICVLHEEPAFAELFMVYMLAHFGKEGEPETIIPKISQ
jgi:hypothetical protein